jgi:hypothetical protein
VRLLVPRDWGPMGDQIFAHFFFCGGDPTKRTVSSGSNSAAGRQADVTPENPIMKLMATRISILFLLFLTAPTLGDGVSEFARALNEKDKASFKACCSEDFWETESYWDAPERFYRKATAKFLVEEITQFHSGDRIAVALNLRGRKPDDRGFETVYFLLTKGLVSGITSDLNHALFFLCDKAPAQFTISDLPSNSALETLAEKLEVSDHYRRHAAGLVSAPTRTTHHLSEAGRGVIVWSGEKRDLDSPTDGPESEVFSVFCRLAGSVWLPYKWVKKTPKKSFFINEFSDPGYTPAERGLKDCKMRLRTLATAVEFWSLDNDRIPADLWSLVPRYFETVPFCPAASKDDASGFYH